MTERTFAIEKIGKWALIGLRVAGLCLAGYLLFSLSAHSVSALWDVASIIIVVGPIFLVCGFLKWRYDAPAAPSSIHWGPLSDYLVSVWDLFLCFPT